MSHLASGTDCREIPQEYCRTANLSSAAKFRIVQFQCSLKDTRCIHFSQAKAIPKATADVL
jgi:hypothetical protein